MSPERVEALTRDHFDVVIVGSGVAGGRVALDLTEAGARCLILEAGEDLDSKQLPLGEADMIARLYWNGGLELSRRGSIVFTRGRCVGGGSVVNQALMDRFDAAILGRWSDESGVDWLKDPGFAAAYDTAEADISIRDIPRKRFNGNVSRVSEAFESAGLAWRPLRRAETAACDGQDCMACLGGCAVESKQSARVTTLRRARALGAQLVAECSVDRIEVASGGVRVRARHGGTERVFSADRVVMAAGAIGTTALLLRSGFGRGLPRLGEGFHCHPQFMTTAVLDDPVEAHLGAFQGATAYGTGGESERPAGGGRPGAVGRSDGGGRAGAGGRSGGDGRAGASGRSGGDGRAGANGRSGGDGRAGRQEPRFKFETSFVPPIIFHTLFARMGADVHALERSYTHRLGIEICLRDTEPGRLSVRRGGRIEMRKELGAGDREAKREAIEILREIYAAAGARDAEFSPRAFSVHPMGGCALGDTPARGVVGPGFQLHGAPQIYVADSSLFPSAPGKNPSLTVMALATRAASALLREAGGGAAA